MLLGVFSLSVAVAGVEPIYECGTVITEPGKYKLITDLTDCPEGGVTIAVSDVKLDLKGHTITCATTDDLIGGVVAIPWFDEVIRNVEIKNGYVENCNDGVVLIAAENSKVKHITASGSRKLGEGYGTGITVAWSANNKITHNHTFGNGTDGILAFDGSGNLFQHNVSTDNVLGTGIWANYQDGSKFLCNRVEGNFSGIIIGPDATGNLVRGNYATGNNDGIGVAGFAWEGYYWRLIGVDNVFKHNLAEGNYTQDVFEILFDVVTWEYLLEPDGQCLNKWVKNDYGIPFGPAGCFGKPRELDDDDVCAIDDDDDDDDEDDDD